MKNFFRLIMFLISTVIRLLPLIIFAAVHFFWEVYSYQLDPLELLKFEKLPSLLGDFLWLYIALTIVIMVFLALKFRFLAYGVFLGALAGQNFYFLRNWDNTIYHLGLKSGIGTWYALIFGGLLVGFILQTLYTGGRKVYKISKYNRIRKSNTAAKSNN